MPTLQARIDAVVREVRKFHTIGVRSLRNRPGRGALGEGSINKEAASRGVGIDYLRKARVFANLESGYSPNELEALCQAIHSGFKKFVVRGTAFGVSHVIRLLSIPKTNRVRARLQTRTFAKGWSVGELDDEIRTTFGRRRKGGRPRHVGDGGDLLVQLEAFCESWRRWHVRLQGKNEANRQRTPLDDLPAEIREVVLRTAHAITKLHAVVKSSLVERTASGTSSPASTKRS